MISFRGGGDLEHRKLGPFIDHEERLEMCPALTGCSPSAQMTPRDRQGTRNGKIPQHMRRLLVYQLDHRMSAPLQGRLLTSPPFLLFKSNRPPILMRVEIEVKSPVCKIGALHKTSSQAHHPKGSWSAPVSFFLGEGHLDTQPS